MNAEPSIPFQAGVMAPACRRLTAAMRWRFCSRPLGDRFQQREHRGAVRLLRTWRPQSGHTGSGAGSGRPARRARQRAVRRRDESGMVRLY
jgi:hypothetical protein